MSGVTTTFNLTPNAQAATPAARPGHGDGAAIDQAYRAEATRFERAAPAQSPAQHGSGPVQTTLALGEEDGGATAGPVYSTHAAPADSGVYEVTTLALGEEDGGGISQSAVPIRDDHSVIGQYTDGGRIDGSQDGYGRMQPIFSPGEPEYPAFAKTSETVDLLNFHPVARVPQTSVPVTYAPPPASAAPPVIIGDVGPSVTGVETVSGSYQSVGSYDDYVAGQPGISVGETAAYEPAAPEPVYESVGSAFPLSTYETAPVQAAPVETVSPQAETYSSPLQTPEPMAKPDLIQKDTPFDYTGPVDDTDPADGNPTYSAPVEAVAPAQAEASYIEVPIDSYLVDVQSSAAAAPAAATGQTGGAAPSIEPLPAPPPAPGDGVSLGGSYTVIDQAPAIEQGTGGVSADPSPEPLPGSDEDLRITTLAIGEEDGS